MREFLVYILTSNDHGEAGVALCGRRDVHMGFDGRIILKWTLKKQDVIPYTGYIWLRTGGTVMMTLTLRRLMSYIYIYIYIYIWSTHS